MDPGCGAGGRILILILTIFAIDDYVYEALKPAPAGSSSKTTLPSS